MIKIEQLAGIVLCGGRSRRMGQEKYRLSFAGETLLQRICRIVQPEVSRILIVAAVDQQIPQSESDIQVLRDEIPDAGHQKTTKKRSEPSCRMDIHVRRLAIERRRDGSCSAHESRLG